MRHYDDPSRPELDWSPVTFRKWLESLPPDQVVGYPCSRRACPLAEFLKTQLWLDFTVDINGQTTNIDGRASSTPEWAQQFIRLVDSKDEAITAARAIEVLKIVARF